VSISTNSVSRVGFSAIPCIAAKRVQKVTIVSKATTTLRIGKTVVVSTYSGSILNFLLLVLVLLRNVIIEITVVIIARVVVVDVSNVFRK
jgi:hypothetical protein